MNLKYYTKEHLKGEFELKAKFGEMDSKRAHLLDRARQYARWTVPNVLPEVGAEEEEMDTDYQSVGAQGVTNLVNKLMMALFQPSRPFFRMNLSTAQREQIQAETGAESAQVDEQLADAEREALHKFNGTNARVALYSTLEHTMVTGGTLLYMPRSGENYRQYAMNNFVQDLDLDGELVSCIVRETKVVAALGDELQTICKENNFELKDSVTIYTGIKRVAEDRYMVHQELEDLAYCHRRVGIYSRDTNPWRPIVWDLARGADYGTGLIEKNAGDFHKLSELAQAINDYSLVVTDIKNLVNPTGMTDVQTIQDSPSGSYVPGREEDLYVHTANVSNTTDFLTQQFDSVARRLGAVFLLNSAVTRDAERVTAQELRMQAQELEGSLGGVYSRLGSSLQLPLARNLLVDLDPSFSDIEPVITTGLESLSRNSELDNFRAFMQDLIIMADVPEEAAKWINYGDVISTLSAGHGVNSKKFLKSAEQVEAETKQNMQQQAEMTGMDESAKVNAQAQVQG